MTKPAHQFVAFNRLFCRMRHRWPTELVEAGTFLRLELWNARLKGWREGGGVQRLDDYLVDFWARAIAWQRARKFKAGSYLGSS